MSTMTAAWSEITIGLYEHELTEESNLLSIRKKSIREKVPWTGEKKENCLALGLKNRHTSETAYCSMNSRMALDDLDWTHGLIDERSSEGSRQQLKSPPRMSWQEFKSGREKKKVLKKPSLSQFGPYTFAKVRSLPQIFPETISAHWGLI